MSMTMKQLKYLCSLALDVNGLTVREKRESGSLPTVFINYSGHVALISISVHVDGWERYACADERFEMYTDHQFDRRTYDKAVSRLKELKRDVDRELKSAQEAGTSV